MYSGFYISLIDRFLFTNFLFPFVRTLLISREAAERKHHKAASFPTTRMQHAFVQE